MLKITGERLLVVTSVKMQRAENCYVVRDFVAPCKSPLLQTYLNFNTDHIRYTDLVKCFCLFFMLLQIIVFD